MKDDSEGCVWEESQHSFVRIDLVGSNLYDALLEHRGYTAEVRAGRSFSSAGIVCGEGVLALCFVWMSCGSRPRNGWGT